MEQRIFLHLKLQMSWLSSLFSFGYNKSVEEYIQIQIYLPFWTHETF